MRWGNVNELIKKDAKDLVEFMNKKITNPNKNILYIDGADHSYHGKNEQLAEEIKKFLGEINVEK
jgi:alpha/beta superfamily hydrolase